MSASSGRSGGQYLRKRTIQACLTCRARKSRCDGARPRCGFCVRNESDCNYADAEPYKLDIGSIKILERMASLEDNLVQTLKDAGISSSRLTRPHSPQRTPALGPLHHRQDGSLWLNGDVVGTWGAISNYFVDEPGAAPLLHFAEELRRCRDGEASPSSQFPTSLTVLAKFDGLAYTPSEPVSSTAGEDESPLPRMQDYAAPINGSWVADLQNYIVRIHSRSPILDLHRLQQVEAYASAGMVDFAQPCLTELPANLDPADVSILLLAVALGQVTSLEVGSAAVDTGQYARLAMPWLGLASFASQDSIKSLQAHILLASYYMWTLKHWDAWCLVDSLASKAEKLLASQPDLIDDSLSHRVMWALAKMQLELSEECQIHYPCQRWGRLQELITNTPLPKPPTEPFEWPNVESSLESDTWFYYLAETSSRRLVERVKAELYSGPSDASYFEWIRSAFPLACELERQVEEWMSALPAVFQRGYTSRDPGPAEESPISWTSSHVGAQSAREGMGRALQDRMRQLQMLIFRPFLAALQAQRERSGSVQTGLPSSSPLSRGATKYLGYATVFLIEQPEIVVRHYGSWLLARNVWTAALSCLAALGDGLVLSHDMTRTSDASFSSPPASVGQSSREEVFEAVGRAHSVLWQWRRESPSLAICGRILTFVRDKAGEQAAADAHMM